MSPSPSTSRTIDILAEGGITVVCVGGVKAGDAARVVSEVSGEVSDDESMMDMIGMVRVKDQEVEICCCLLWMDVYRSER